MTVSSFRKMEPRDVPQMVRVAVETGMFRAEAASFLESSAQVWFDGGPGHWIVDEVAGVLVAVAFYEPRPATDRVWAVTMIAVAPAHQRSGRGAALLRFIEAVLRKDGQRILVIETSGTAAYDRTRQFYAKLGYDAVAQVPNYFADGDDMVLFAKDLREK